MVIITPRPLYQREITPLLIGGWVGPIADRVFLCQGDDHIGYIEITSLGSEVTGQLTCGCDTEFIWEIGPNIAIFVE